MCLDMLVLLQPHDLPAGERGAYILRSSPCTITTPLPLSKSPPFPNSKLSISPTYVAECVRYGFPDSLINV